MDLHSKKIIGYHFSKQMTKDLIVQGLKNAYFSQRPKDKVILHTDLGTQYTNQDFKNLTFLCPKYLDLGQYFGHKKVKFLSSLSCKLLTFFRSQIVNRSMNSFAIIPAFYVLK